MRPALILLVTPSNCAVDEIVSRLISSGILGSDGLSRKPRVVRVGQIEKMVSPHAKVFSYVQASVSVHLDELVKRKLAFAEHTGKPTERRKQLERQVLENAEIIASTLVGSGCDTLLRLSRKKGAEGGGVVGGTFFDVIVVDEATQVCEL
ncbi:MAG: hypothetical protein SGPRY_005744 [Prymnesium sp.]